MYNFYVHGVQVRLAKPEPTTTNNNNNTAQHLQRVQPQYVPADSPPGSQGSQGSEVPSQGMLCRWEFDVTGYQPTELSVKVTDDRKLRVSARHADVKDADNSSSRQLNKQVDIPPDVVHEEMTSYMTREGVLVVQAPVSHDVTLTSQLKMAAVNGAGKDDVDCRFRPIELPPEQPPGDDVISASRRHVVKTGSHHINIVRAVQQ